jgi:hypothetical protein
MSAGIHGRNKECDEGIVSIPRGGNVRTTTDCFHKCTFVLVMTGFSIAAIVGFKSSAWIVVGGLAGHGVFDAIRGYALENPKVPIWWPAFCLTFDLGAAVGLAWVIQHRAGGFRVLSRSA